MSGSKLPEKRSLLSIRVSWKKRLTPFSRSIEIRFHMLNAADHDDVRAQTTQAFSFAVVRIHASSSSEPHIAPAHRCLRRAKTRISRGSDWKRTAERGHSRHRVRLIHFDEESDGSLVARVRPFYARARVLGIVSWQNLRRNGRAK
jgi:hypothetical protein